MSIFDINRDGKVDFTDHFLTYDILKTIDDCIADEKRKTRNDSWRDDCDPDYESDIDPDDFDSQEEYMDAVEEAKYEWREYCEDGWEYDLDPMDFETEEEYQDALEEAIQCSEESDDF